MKVNDLAFVSDEAPDDAHGFEAWLYENAATPGVRVTVRDMGRKQVDGGAPHVDIEGDPTSVMAWLTTHYCADDPSSLEDVLSSGVEWGSPRRLATALDDVGRGPDGRFPDAPEFFKKFRPKENVWNHYDHFQAVRTTTDKLTEQLESNAWDLALVEGGDLPPADGWEIVQVTFTGGRDWIIILGNVGA